MSDRPANINFGNEDDEDAIDLAMTDQSDEVAPLRQVKPKKKSLLPIMIGAGAFVLVALVVMVYLVSMKLNRSRTSELVEDTYSAPAQQPQIVESSNLPAKLNQMQLPATDPADVSSMSAPQGNPAIADTKPVASNVPTPAVGAMQIAPQAQSDPALKEKQLVLESKINAVVDQLDALQRQLVALESTLASIKDRPATKTDKATVAATAVAAPNTPAKKVVAQPKNLKEKPEPTVVQSTTVKVTEQPLAMPAQPATSASSSVAKDYQISTIIGTRAWVVKRNSDGSESEFSVSPGERVDGKKVLSVDGLNSKCVALEDNQKICIRH